MAQVDVANTLSANFRAFFKRLNPSPTYVSAASSAQLRIRELLEDRDGVAGDLRVRCFIQGSYGTHTAIHTINDVDIVALCGVSWSENANRTTRDKIFQVLSSAIAADRIYRDKIRCGTGSICIKVELAGVKVEVLPSLHAPEKGFGYEPFHMFRPEEGLRAEGWVPAFGRYHQRRLREKNGATNGTFIPLVKTVKHIRSVYPKLDDVDAISFHLECLLYAIRDRTYSNSIPECIERVLGAIAGLNPEKAESSSVLTPCREKHLFSPTEWQIAAYERFHQSVVCWHQLATMANAESNEDKAIDLWQELLGKWYFPRDPNE